MVTDASKRTDRSRGGQARAEAHRATENCNITRICLRVALGTELVAHRMFSTEHSAGNHARSSRALASPGGHTGAARFAAARRRRRSVAQAPFLVISLGVFDASARRRRIRTRTRADLRAAVPIRNSAALNMVTMRIAFPQSIMPADSYGAVRICRGSHASRESRHDTPTAQAKEQAAGTPSGGRHRIEMGESALTTSPPLARH